MSDARKAALTALEKCRRMDAWSDAVLGSVMDAEQLQGRDRALASALCYGVLQNRILLDHVVMQLSSIPMKKIEPKVLDILRLSLYQIMMLDRIPNSAAVNEGVRLCRNSGFSRAAGFVNALLRRAAEGKYQLPTGNSAEALSLRYSHPLWLVEYLMRRLGPEETEQLLICHNSEVPISIQVNILRSSADKLLNELTAQDKTVCPHDFLPECIQLIQSGDIRKLRQFSDGDFYVQDAAAKMAVLAANPGANDRVIDVCAAPGGKSFAAAMLNNNGYVLSCDLHENKLKRIHEGAARLGLNGIETAALDAREFKPEFAEKFNVVIADVPCSGLGVIRKKPDIRYKDPAAFEELPAIQSAIIENVCRYVAPGGVLLYSTCTVRSEENEDVVARFLSANNFLGLEDFELPGGCMSQNGMIQFWPHKHGTDGFFVAKLRKLK